MSRITLLGLLVACLTSPCFADEIGREGTDQLQTSTNNLDLREKQLPEPEVIEDRGSPVDRESPPATADRNTNSDPNIESSGIETSPQETEPPISRETVETTLPQVEKVDAESQIETPPKPLDPCAETSCYDGMTCNVVDGEASCQCKPGHVPDQNSPRGCVVKPYFFVAAGFYDVIDVSSEDGTAFYVTDTEYINVPKRRNGIGPGIRLGGMINDKLSLEMGYVLTIHDYTGQMYSLSDSEEAPVESRDIKGKIFEHDWKFAARRFFNSGKVVRPYLNLFDFTITVEKAKGVSYRFASPETLGDARFTGMSIGVGGGIAFQLTNSIIINFGVVPSWHLMNAVKGESKDEYDTEAISSFRLEAEGGIIIGFRKGTRKGGVK